MLSSLNDAQKEAVTHRDGPLLVFAGAGSGKTRVITYRIAWLIEQGIVEPESILAVTFTRKAAGEMKERVRKLLSEQRTARLPYIGTFHSFGATVLRRDGYQIGIPSGFSIFDPEDQLHVVKQIMDDQNIDRKMYNPSVVLSNISSSKNEMISPKEYTQYVQGPFDEVVATVYPLYEEQLREQAAVDFDDLQLLPLQLLNDFPKILQKYNEQYRFVLVDEYQDTNMVQYQLVKLLAGGQRNICVVGDDDQGIYSWRGATIKNILSFERDFPGTAVVRLEKNYRSSAHILQAAQSVISNNNERAPKEIWTDAEPGERISLYEARNERDEAKYVGANIDMYLRSGGALREVGILYRVNAQSRAIEEELLRRAIPYRLVGGVRFYERQEIKDMLAYLRFLANPQDDVSCMRIINVPPRKMGKKSVDRLLDQVEKMAGGDLNAGQMILAAWGHLSDKADWDTYFPGMSDKKKRLQQVFDHELFDDFAEENANLISQFGKLYEKSKTCPVRELIDEILEAVGYEKWIDDGTPQAESRLENLYELKVVADKHDPLGPRDSLLAFLEDVALVEQEQESEDVDRDSREGVTLMTMHAAKGLEFQVVFMIGMEEGLFPHIRSFTSPSELEEERRLCYVGITRAKRKLHMTFAEDRRMYGGMADRIPSRFISEIPEELLQFSSWQ